MGLGWGGQPWLQGAPSPGLQEKGTGGVHTHVHTHAVDSRLTPGNPGADTRGPAGRLERPALGGVTPRKGWFLCKVLNAGSGFG